MADGSVKDSVCGRKVIANGITGVSGEVFQAANGIGGRKAVTVVKANMVNEYRER